ncbi:MAG: 23S rRNA (uracil(1939)-C(5))-methyltransferase RlmD [Proteobacteria bacterium]|nr:23S rRNA (uracil(1939)-C(5))-methyltransferase RlmD [Pseudomonadota bacterium]MBU1610794.1 23S rRNA (uracil(1939)-C(5))-methyltransferase RlmD [Pseudomonadota bacterium]
MTMQLHDIIECTIESLAFGGRGVARVEGRVFFVERVVPGQTVKARITKLSKRFAEAISVEVIKQSPDFTEPFCRHFGECGGCAHQDVSYAAQLREKQAQVVDAMARIGKLEFEEVLPILGSPKERNYRNKMEFSFSGKGKGLSLGLRERGGKTVVDIVTCHLMSEECVTLVNEVREFCRESGIPAYDPKTQEGFWRHLVVRESVASGERMAHLITSSGRRHFDVVGSLGDYLTGAWGVDRFVHSTRKSRAELAFGEWEVRDMGGRLIEERLQVADRSVRYAISPNAFFQPNSHTAALLYSTVLEFAGLTGSESVLDLYCGSGGISLALAGHAAKVVGIELAVASVQNADYSAKLNNLDNCLFLASDLGEESGTLKNASRPDVLVVDPPRGGMRPEVVDAIRTLGPNRVVAVSCDPPALARDLARLGYRPVKLQAIDQFPQTPHVECVALLEKA